MIRAWDDNSCEVKKLGLGASSGWLVKGSINFATSVVAWTCDFPVADGQDYKAKALVNDYIDNWLAEVTQERLEQNCEWNLL